MGNLITEANIVYLPWDLAFEPRQGLVQCYTNTWWEVHPTKGLAFFRRGGLLAAQCNSSEAVIRRLLADTKDPELGHEARFVGRVYVPQRVSYGREGAEIGTMVLG